jgi:hypothetical protein
MSVLFTDDDETDLSELVALAFQAVSRLSETKDNLWDRITAGDAALIAEHNDLRAFTAMLETAAERFDYSE